eukprot:CAMPEP_0197569392 /NCGR_PEP_ID=MMETSP1320-20131121/38932_1 /TAXON_ID=91990 /ORGANISM="Bolidomonas sp., Strain RCC2347" /LENGTH=55 /DNA_ID=CAMNT_0043131749 /DNA_START=66 /DNA_END=230 /DNA_ORIENTATION=-
MAEMMEKYPNLFREFLVTSGVHVARGQRNYAKFRFIIGTLISMFDMGTDIFMVFR